MTDKPRKTQPLPDSEARQSLEKNLQAPSHPDMIGRFHVKRRLGEGGMGIVYLADDPDLHRTVIIKVIRDERAHDDHFHKLFRREAELAANIDHPNVVKIHEFDADNLVLVMEYVSGGNLKQLLSTRGALDTDKALHIVAGIARALDAAYEHNIVHRDIKPSNILLTRDGEPKLADLGIAKRIRQPGTQSTLTGDSPGTPGDSGRERQRYQW